MRYCKVCRTEKPESEFYDHRHRCKECKKKGVRMRFLERKFGITFEEYTEMEHSQNGVCAICKKFETHRRGQQLCVDHDHGTGAVRGLLCHHCNTALGLFGDNVENLSNAIDYLRKHEQ